MTDSTEQSALHAKSVVKRFGHGSSAVTASNHVSVTINENEFFTLSGPPSRCGKTTLLRLIAGSDHPQFNIASILFPRLKPSSVAT